EIGERGASGIFGEGFHLGHGTRRTGYRSLRPSSAYFFPSSGAIFSSAIQGLGMTDAVKTPLRMTRNGGASAFAAGVWRVVGGIWRSSAIELKGSGLGSVPVNRIVRGIEEVLHAAVVGRFQMATKPIPLSEVERVWSNDAYMPRVVFTIGEQRG